MDFESYLKKFRKRNGERLLNKTIKNYLYLVDKEKSILDEAYNNDELINTMNFLIHQRGNNSIRAAFITYLKYLREQGVYFLKCPFCGNRVTVFADKPKDLNINCNLCNNKVIISEERLRDYNDEINKALVKPKTHASAVASKRFLQSKILDREELKTLFDYIGYKMLKLAIAISYDTACRRSELLNIQFKDIKTANDEDKQNGIFANIQLHGKGSKKRTVYLRETAYNLFYQMYRGKKINKKDKVIVFRKDNGEGDKYKSQEQSYYDLLTKAGQDIIGRRVHPHMLRHTQATHMAEAGAEIKDLSNYLGHENISTSMIYIEMSSAMGKRGFRFYARDLNE